MTLSLTTGLDDPQRVLEVGPVLFLPRSPTCSTLLLDIGQHSPKFFTVITKICLFQQKKQIFIYDDTILSTRFYKHSLVTKLHFSKCINYSSFEFKMTMYQVMILRIFWLVPKYTTQVYSSKFLSYKLDLIIIKFSKIQFPHCTFKASIINKYPHPLVKFRHLSLAYERKRN